MELKAKLFPIINPNGRILWMDPSKKAFSAHSSELTLLGRTVNITVDPKTKEKTVVETGYVLYETADLDVVIVEADLVPAVKGIGLKTLETLIQSTDLTPMLAVTQGMAEFSHTLTEGYYSLEGRKHVWGEKKKEDAKEETKEDQDQDQSHF